MKILDENICKELRKVVNSSRNKIGLNFLPLR